MIIDFHKCYGGGGSSSAVTPQEVQQQIDSALTPYWESGETQSAISEAVSGLATEQYVQDALSGVSLEGYWNSAQTEEAISAATSGKADAANVTANQTDLMRFSLWNEQGIITGSGRNCQNKRQYINGNFHNFLSITNADGPDIWAPTTHGTAGEVLVSAGNGAPVWSAVTMPDMSEYTPTSGFATVNGSAITNGGNLVIEGGSGPAPDLSGYMTSGDAQVISTALNDLNDKVEAITGQSPDLSAYYTSAQTESAITQAVSGKADAANVSANTNAYVFPTWNTQGVITGTNGNSLFYRQFKINNANYPVIGGGASGPMPTIYVPKTSGETGQILTPSGNTPVWVTPATINGSAITAGGNIEIQAGGITSADVKTQIEAYNYMDQEDAQVISTSLNDLNTNKVAGTGIMNIVRIEKSDYDTLVAQSATTSTTLYVVVPDEQ